MLSRRAEFMPAWGPELKYIIRKNIVSHEKILPILFQKGGRNEKK